MGWFRRKTAVAVSRAGTTTLTAEPDEPPTGPEVYTGTVTEPEATKAMRINSAADIDPNIKKYGDAGVFRGGGGGYGGAGTK